MTMQRRSRMVGAALGAVCLALAACDDEAPAPAPKTDITAELAAINMTPNTLEEAEVQFARLDALSKLSKGDARVLAATRQLADNIEPLNGLVDKITVGEGHTVSFYADANGESQGIAEGAPTGTASMVRPLLDKGLSFVDVFKTLAPARELPTALLKVAAPAARGPSGDDGATIAPQISPASQISPATSARPGSADGVTTVQSALGEGDGPWFAQNVCPTSGSFVWCKPNWWDGGGADSGGKVTTSYFRIAPFAGDALNVRRFWNGALQNTLTVFPGELKYYYQRGAKITDCCFLCPVCDVYYAKGRHKWDIINGIGDGFHWAGAFLNESAPPF